ncbi:cobalamin biosynthesis protein [Novispirillum sp. DQ9]|uniref:cobalamin biosynthesis protein n=1 Tax=Novispirillum sp. DQ9 TaxID=3398612 RepID=UPI003C7CC7D9
MPENAIIVAGFGCRKGVSVEQVRAAYEAAGVEASELATAHVKAAEPALVAFAAALGLPLRAVPQDALAAAPAVTVSQASLREAGVPSVAECAALAAAGPGARLIVPRVVVGPVTCAIAQSGQDLSGEPPP